MRREPGIFSAIEYVTGAQQWKYFREGLFLRSYLTFTLGLRGEWFWLRHQ